MDELRDPTTLSLRNPSENPTKTLRKPYESPAVRLIILGLEEISLRGVYETVHVLN